MKNLNIIRCPFRFKKKQTNKLYNCNRICGKVSDNSFGELFCRTCHLTFEFEVNNGEIKRTVRVKKIQ